MFDSNDPKNSIKLRAKTVFYAILILNLILIISLYRLQINNAEKYVLLSNRNRIRLSPILPKRGHIMTSDGKIIAGNICRYKLIMDRCSDQIFQKNMNILEQFINFSNEDIVSILDQRKRKLPAVVIKDGLSWNEYSRLSMILFKLKNVSLENIYVRNYTMPLEFGHIVGHTSKNSDSIPILVGKIGIESSLNDQLIGEIGNIQTEVNAVGQKVRILDSRDPIEGKDVILTIDTQIQKYVYDLLSAEKAGACVVLDISNGEVLAMVSVPTFNPNVISGKMTNSQWRSITGDPLFPLMNRAVSCSYPPGSIFKIIVAFAALSEGVVSAKDKILCTGGIKMDDRVFHCWNRAGHGRVDLYDALKFSCDCYFFEIAKKLGIDAIVEYAKKFGFGSKTGIELPSENVGLLPTKRWKFLRYGTSWKSYETMIAGIGQGALLATPMQLAVMLGKLYTEDYNFSPTLIKSAKKNQVTNPIHREHLDIIKNALYQVCIFGTASGSCRTDYGISGKTGSSQVRRIKPQEVGLNQKSIPWASRDHAFFVGCAPYKNPRYVVAVLVEHGGGGAAVAAPIARKIFDRLMKK
ncbi:MAG: penicillin-binding protein 2 [Holosporaceae bacterium]|jgi:penicillin-binding protein 2|nr:penicillin-binding protein 2 [Holosporaceae bacterium]